MRLSRRTRDTKTSAARREVVSAAVDTARDMFDDEPVRTSPMSGTRRVKTLRPLPPSARPVAEVAEDVAVPPPPPLPSYERLEDSDVFVCTPEPEPESEPAPASTIEVTLFVYGWKEVEPGPLWWVFPSLKAALDAVQRMKNAVGWSIVSGNEWDDLDTARASGAVLVEQQG
jgi:hypothetical protein